MSKIVSAKEAIAKIKDNDTVAVGGFGSYACPDYLLEKLAERYGETGCPKNLTTVTGITPGDNSPNPIGMNRIAIEGLIGNSIAGHFANSAKLSELVAENKTGGYALPLGVVVHLIRASAAHSDYIVSKVGIGTYADPRYEGCKINQKAKEAGRDIVDLVEINGKEYLAYHTFKLNVCIIRGTFADEKGNISMEQEAVGDYALLMAEATHNNGGTVIVQVKDVVQNGSLNPKKVIIGHTLVDYVVKCENPEEYHKQSYADYYRPELCGQAEGGTINIKPMELSNRKVIARRGAAELNSGLLINLGIGIPSGVGVVAHEMGIQNISLSLESGPQGGVPVEGLGFGASVNADVIYQVADTFDAYDGGVLDMTFLGAAEIDAEGNVNVSKFGKRCMGPGGFINITQSTKRIVFMGTFTAGGLEEEFTEGRLIIKQEGKQKKFVNKVQQITFSGKVAMENKLEVLFITERAVFRLTEKGIVLEEVAPGMDIEKDILEQMEFRPILADKIKIINPDYYK